MKAIFAVCCAVVWLLAAPPLFATSFGLLLGDSNIQGESLDPAFPGGIDVHSVSIEGSLELGSLGRVVLHKQVDKSTPKLMEACARGQHLRKATLIGRTVGDDPRSFLVVEFIDVLVAGVTQDKPEPGQETVEAVALQFAAVHFIYHTLNDERTAAFLSPLQGGTDSDGDGIPDAIEVHYGMDHLVADSHLDLDGDGLDNITELRLGLNPASASSYFRAEASPIRGDPNGIALAWDSVPGKPYLIDWSPDLKPPFTNFTNHTPEGTRASVRLSKTGLRGFFIVRPAN